jgi:hypothetical protein
MVFRDSPSDPRSAASEAVLFGDWGDENQRLGHLIGTGGPNQQSGRKPEVVSSRRNAGGHLRNPQIDLMSVAWATVRLRRRGALTEVSHRLAGTGGPNQQNGRKPEVSSAGPSAASEAVLFGDWGDENQSAWGRSSPSECTCRTDHSI